MNKKTINLLIAILSVVSMTSCQSYSDGRMLKKFISRFNQEEYSSASTYIFPADRMEFALFVQQVKPMAPDAIVELEDYETTGDNNNRQLNAQLKWTNATPAIETYFNNIGCPIDPNGMQNVSIKIKDTKDGEMMSFLWANPYLANVKLSHASIKTNDSKPVTDVPIYTSKSSTSKPIGIFEDEAIVGEESEDGWYEIYEVDKTGNITNTYFKKDPAISIDSSAFFHLGLLDSLGIVVAIIIIVVVVAVVFLLCGTASSFLNGIQWGGPVLLICLILGGLYLIYQMLEKILFELFIINLPY